MQQDENTDIQNDNYRFSNSDRMRYTLAETICELNRIRAQFVPNATFGDPIWDMVLTLYTSEYFDRSTTISNLSETCGIPHSVATRCISYLLGQEAIFENTSRSNKETMPYLVTDGTKTAVGCWLDNCISNSQMDLAT
jgi:hypothetical protein